MSIGKMIKTAMSAGGSGLSGSINAAGIGMSAYISHQTYSEKYGSGAAIGMGLAEGAVFTVTPMAIALPAMAIAYGGYHAMTAGAERYREKRKVRMGKPVEDLYGTLATMRQRSRQALGRGRAVLGQEARLMHY